MAEAPGPEDFIIPPNRISKESLGSMVHDDDRQWFSTLLNELFLLLSRLKSLGLTSANVDSLTQLQAQ